MRTLILTVAAWLGLAMSGAALAQDFPVTLEHMYGSTTVPKAPERVVSLGFAGHDDILALGIHPVALRYWYGDYPHGVWPWAEDALGGTEPVVLKGDLNIEQIAALQPDLILAINSGITKEQYDLLSQIAPTVASEAQYGDYGTPWQAEVTADGKALGKSAEAAAAITALEDRFASIRAAHPDWEGKTAAVSFIYNDAPGAYRSIDGRPRFLNSLGFVTPAAIDKAGGEKDFYVSLSAEDLTPFDTDLLIWFDDENKIGTLKLRSTLKAYKEGREIFPDTLLSGAFSHASLLSIGYALDKMVPLIELAIDGDPATVVPGTKPAP